MANPVGSIVVSISADTSQLIKDVGKANTALGKVGSVAASAGKAIAASMVAATAAITALTLKGIKLGDEMDEAAQRIGATVTELAGLRYAAQFAGVESGALDTALAKLARTTSLAATGNKVATESFKRLGLSGEELRQLPLSEQMLKVSDALKGLKNDTDRVRAAQELFGKSGAALIPLLNQGSEAIRKQTEEASELGLRLDDVQRGGIADASDAIDRMKSAFAGLSLQMGATFAPIVEKVSGAIARLTSFVTKALPGLSELAQRILGISIAIEDLGDANLDARKKLVLDELEEQAALLKRIEQDMPDSKMPKFLQEAYNASLLKTLELRRELADITAEETKRRQAGMAPKPEATGGVEFDSDEAMDEAAKAAKAELDLITAVAAEKERIALLEIEQNREWATVLAEEKEAARVGEIEAERALAQALFEERELAAKMEFEQFLGHQTALSKIAQDAAKERAEFEKKTSFDKTQSVLGDLVSMTAGVAQHSKKMFQLNKLAAIGNAVINTAQGVTRALAAYPPPISFVMAAAQAAAGAAQISAIKSTQFQGGGTGTTPSAAATPVVNDQPVTGTGAAPGKGNTIRVEGIDSNSLFTGRALRELLERLQDAQKDGGKLVIV